MWNVIAFPCPWYCFWHHTPGIASSLLLKDAVSLTTCVGFQKENTDLCMASPLWENWFTYFPIRYSNAGAFPCYRYEKGSTGTYIISCVMMAQTISVLSTLYIELSLSEKIDPPNKTDVNGLTTCRSPLSKYIQGSQITIFMGPTWGPPGSSWPQIGPMLAPWTLLSVIILSEGNIKGGGK